MSDFNVSFSEHFKTHCQDYLGVRPAHVASALEQYDRMQSLDRGSGEQVSSIELYLKRVNRRTPPICLLVQAEVGGPPSPTTSTSVGSLSAQVYERGEPGSGREASLYIEAAWPIPAHLLASDTTPLEALEILTTRYGKYVEIAGERKKLIVAKTFPLTDSLEVTFESRGEGEVVALGGRLVPDREADLMRAYLLYAIDLQKLRAAL